MPRLFARRSVSMRGPVYDELLARCQAEGTTLSHVVDRLVCDFLGPDACMRIELRIAEAKAARERQRVLSQAEKYRQRAEQLASPAPERDPVVVRIVEQKYADEPEPEPEPAPVALVPEPAPAAAPVLPERPALRLVEPAEALAVEAVVPEPEQAEASEPAPEPEQAEAPEPEQAEAPEQAADVPEPVALSLVEEALDDEGDAEEATLSKRERLERIRALMERRQRFCDSP